MKGLNILAIAFPFYFLGPAIYYWKGGPELQNHNWYWAAGAIMLMFIAVALTIRALAIVLDAFFEK